MKRMAMLDWSAIKCFHLRLFLLPIISLAAGFVSVLLVVPTNVFLFLFFSVNTFAVEEKGDLNKLYLTLPVKRSAVVAGRYVLSICMGFAGLATGIPLAIFCGPLFAVALLWADWMVFTCCDNKLFAVFNFQPLYVSNLIQDGLL